MQSKRINSSTNFKDYFSTSSEDYRQFRPDYPPALFEFLSSQVESHEVAWDCATGSGQSALGLVPYYEKIIATDASKQQIQQAVQHAKIDYQCMPAEQTSLSNSSVDLITVAQALHWFNLGNFTAEVKRVLKPGGVLAVWTYNLLTISSEIDHVVNEFYANTLDAYWPAERKLIEENYQSIAFPFRPLTVPEFEMQHDWSLDQLLGYLSTWSAVKRYQQDRNQNPLDDLISQLQNVWGDVNQVRKVVWPLTVKTWRKA